MITSRRFTKRIRGLQRHKEVLNYISFPTGCYRAASTGSVEISRDEEASKSAQWGLLAKIQCHSEGPGSAASLPSAVLGPERKNRFLWASADKINPTFDHRFSVGSGVYCFLYLHMVKNWAWNGVMKTEKQINKTDNSILFRISICSIDTNWYYATIFFCIWAGIFLFSQQYMDPASKRKPGFKAGNKNI